MAFEGVNVGALKGAISACQGTLNFQLESGVVNQISGSGVWNCLAKNKLISSINDLNGKYGELRGLLQSCMQLADMIERYKKLKQEIEGLTAQSQNLEGSLYYTKREYDEDNNLKETRCMNYGVQSQLQDLGNSIRDKQNQLLALEHQINGFA